MSNTRLMSDDRAVHRRSRPSSHGLSRLGRVLALSEPLQVVRRLDGGLGAATHLLAAGDLRFVLKRYPSDRNVISAEWASLVVANEAGLPVPEVFAADAEGAWFGTPALVMSAVPGHAELSPRNVESYLEAISELLVRVHDIPTSAATHLRTHEPSTWAIDGPIPNGLLPVDTVKQIREAVAPLPEIAAGEPKTFCHGDCHPGNVLWHRGRLTGLVDWSQACTSVRWWELAYMRVELALLTDWDVSTDLLRRYEARIGRRSAHQVCWDLFHVHTGHKWGHTWLEGYRQQGRTDLDLDELARRLANIAALLLSSL